MTLSDRFEPFSVSALSASVVNSASADRINGYALAVLSRQEAASKTEIG